MYIFIDCIDFSLFDPSNYSNWVNDGVTFLLVHFLRIYKVQTAGISNFACQSSVRPMHI